MFQLLSYTVKAQNDFKGLGRHYKCHQFNTNRISGDKEFTPKSAKIFKV